MKQGWEEKTLGEVCKVERGSSPRPIEKFITNNTNGINWIKIGDAKEGEKYIYSTKEKITIEGSSKSRIVNDGDFILSNSMSFGRPYIMKTTGCIHDGWFVLRLNQYINADFFYYLLNSRLIQEQFITLASGAIVKNMRSDLVKKAKVPIPSLQEQQRIVSILDKTFADIDKLKENTQKNLKNAKEVFESYLQSVFENKGEAWEEKRLEECFKLKSGENITSKMMLEDGEYKVYGGNGIAGKFNQFNLIGDNVIVGRVGALCGNVRNIIEPIWLTDNGFKITELKYDFNNAFLTYLLNFKNLRAYARQAAQPVISNSALKDVILNFPKSIEKQKEIVQKLDELQAETKRLEEIYQQKLNSLEELKQAILHKAFNGEL